MEMDLVGTVALPLAPSHSPQHARNNNNINNNINKQAWTEEDEGVPPAITPASATATKPAVGDEEEAKEAPCNPPSHGVAPPVAVGSSSLARSVYIQVAHMHVLTFI